nr:TPA_asm: hypothetical protein HUJ06_023836 [Nelumbo nucifera]
MSPGAIITTTNPFNTTQEIRKQITDSKPVLAFTTHSLLPKFAGMNLPIVLIGEGHDSESGPGANVSRVKIVSSLENMMKKEPNDSRVKDRVCQDDTATLLYSSGTTGASKGMVLSHRNLIAMIQKILGHFKLEEAESRGGPHTFVCSVPMFHIYGLAAFSTGLLTSGSTIVVLSKLDMQEMLSAIARYRATYLPLVSPILVALTNNADVIREKYDIGTCRIAGATVV